MRLDILGMGSTMRPDAPGERAPHPHPPPAPSTAPPSTPPGQALATQAQTPQPHLICPLPPKPVASLATSNGEIQSNDDPTMEQLDWGSIHDEDGAFGQLSTAAATIEEGVPFSPDLQEAGRGNVINGDAVRAASLPLRSDPLFPPREGELSGGAGGASATPNDEDGTRNQSDAVLLPAASPVSPKRLHDAAKAQAAPFATQEVSRGDVVAAAAGSRARRSYSPAAPAAGADTDAYTRIHAITKVRRNPSKHASLASELYHPKAPNVPIRAKVREGRSYCEVARSRPPTARPYAPRRRAQWRPLLLGGNQATPAVYKTPFAGRCFRCLATDHKLAECRDPLCCLACRRSGHLARHCPEKRAGARRPGIHSRLNFPKTSIHSRLASPKSSAPPIHSRLTFPPLPDPKETSQEKEMTWYPGMPENRPASGSAVVISSIAMAEEATRLRTRAVLLVARGRPQHVDIGIGDVSRVVAGCVRMPPNEMRTTRHRPEDFMIIFDSPQQRTLALRVGAVRVKGVSFAITPWTEHSHGGEVHWWYHVRVAIENLPSHAWNLEALKEVLGEVCLIDKIDRATFRQQASDIIYCWAWMWFPDLLPRAKTVTFFRPGAGQASPLLASALPREAAPPPLGHSHNVLIHLDIVEDWSPARERTPSTGQSGVPSSVFSEEDELPRIYNFSDWTPGVMDGVRQLHRPPPETCRPHPRAGHRDDHGPDDDAPRPPPRSLLVRGKQAFASIRSAAGSSGNVGPRCRSRSPSTSRRWETSVPVDGTGNEDRGRRLSRDTPSPRRRDPMRLEHSDWERRRS